MGTLIKMKMEVVNPELSVLTEQGILPYYTGIFVNKLADNSIILSQAEIDAINALVNSLNEANLLDKIGTFYPFMGNPNIALIGNKELAFSDVSQSNTALDFVDGKLRGIKGWQEMSSVKYSQLTTFDYGFAVGGSMISKTKMPHPSNTGVLFKLLAANAQGGTPIIQYRFQGTSQGYKFSIYDFYESQSETNVNFLFEPSAADSNDLNNYSFCHSIANSNNPNNVPSYVRCINKNNENLGYMGGTDANRLHTSDISDYHIAGINVSENVQDRVITTLVFFNEILEKEKAKTFCDILDTFAAAVGKTVSVG